MHPSGGYHATCMPRVISHATCCMTCAVCTVLRAQAWLGAVGRSQLALKDSFGRTVAALKQLGTACKQAEEEEEETDTARAAGSPAETHDDGMSCQATPPLDGWRPYRLDALSAPHAALADSAGAFAVPPCRTLRPVLATRLTRREFVRRFESVGQPALLRNATFAWPAMGVAARSSEGNAEGMVDSDSIGGDGDATNSARAVDGTTGSATAARGVGRGWSVKRLIDVAGDMPALATVMPYQSDSQRRNAARGVCTPDPLIAANLAERHACVDRICPSMMLICACAWCR